jgi:hypothetical protein
VRPDGRTQHLHRERRRSYRVYLIPRYTLFFSLPFVRMKDIKLEEDRRCPHQLRATGVVAQACPVLVYVEKMEMDERAFQQNRARAAGRPSLSSYIPRCSSSCIPVHGAVVSRRRRPTFSKSSLFLFRSSACKTPLMGQFGPV